MSDFDKAKVGFVLALLGTSFAISPVLSEHSELGHDLIGFQLTLGRAHLAFSVLLGLAVYLFAIGFATRKPTPAIQTVGNIVYVFALAVPPLYAILNIGIEVAQFAARTLDVEAAINTFAGLVSALSGALTFRVYLAVYRRLSKKERSAAASDLETEETAQIRRAAQLHDAGHNDLAVLESFRAIESSLRATVLRLDLPFQRASTFKLIRAAEKAGIVPESLWSSLHALRRARNTLVHGEGDITSEDTIGYLATARDILSAIRRFEIREIEDARAEDDIEAPGSSTDK